MGVSNERCGAEIMFQYGTNTVYFGKRENRIGLSIVIIALLSLLVLGYFNQAQGIECNDKEGCKKNYE